MNEYNLITFLKLFLNDPYKEFYLREAAKKTKLSVFAAKKYADLLVKEGLLFEERKANLRYFKANLGKSSVRIIKSAFIINEIEKSGVLEYIKENISGISSVMVFGSSAKGEDSLESDIDILIIGKKSTIDLSDFEKKLGRRINEHIFSWSEWNKQSKDNKAFYLDVLMYGISLYGEKPIVNGNKNS
jgi:predicted nucleotidyltransferase